ncbi:MAG: hypothetical protein AAGA66_00035 [Bacteroidota bacterium]
MKNLLTIITMIHFCVLYAQNQDVIPPSPTSSALGKYVDNPVSLYTGTPEIGIPLYELKVKDYTLPVGLSYHSSGIKVEETASNIGLGWVLNAGGVITRSMKEIPDDYKAPYCPDTWDGTGRRPDCRNGIFHSKENVHDIDVLGAYNRDLYDHDYSLDNVFSRFYSIEPNPNGWSYKKLSDTEPDVFYFNFCGKSGKFVFDVRNGVRTIRILSHHELQITHQLDRYGRLSSFEVTDDQGINYAFTAVEETETIVEANSFPQPFGGKGILSYVYYIPNSRQETKFNSSWYLTKITTPLGEEISFRYEDESSQFIRQGSEQTLLNHAFNFNVYNPNVDRSHHHLQSTVVNLKGKRLVSIQSDDERLTFLSDHERQDIWGYEPRMRPKALTGLIAFSIKPTGIPKRIKKWAFVQDYFTSPVVTTFQVGSLGYRYSKPGAHFAHDRNMNVYFKRLRLRSVQEFGTSEGDELPPTSFEYKYLGFSGWSSAHRLPHRFSFQQDLWGYYNGATGNTRSMIPKQYVYPDMFSDSRRFSVYRRVKRTGREYTLSGADRLPDADLMGVGMLTQINYPTGGFTSYEYEPHTFKDGNEAFSGGGLRIRRIVKRDGLSTDNDMVYNYSYTDGNETAGKVVSIPIFAVSDGAGVRYPLDGTQNAYRANTTRFSVPQGPLGNTKGSNIGYRKVTEFMSGNGRTVYEFAMPALWHERNDRLKISSGPLGPVADCDRAKNGTCDGVYLATRVYDLFPNSTRRSSYFDLSMNPRTYNTFPFPENPNYDWNRGQLLVKSDYNQSGQIVRKETYNYDVWYANGGYAPKKVYGMKFGQYYPRHANPDDNDALPIGNRPYGCFRVAKYRYMTGVAKVLTSRTVRDYQTGTTLATEKTTTYEHKGARHTYVTKMTDQTSQSETLITTMKYPSDYLPVYDAAEGVRALQIGKITANPVETSEYMEKEGTSYLRTSTLTTYKLVGGLPLPARHYMRETATLVDDFNPSFVIPNIGIFIRDQNYEEKFYFKRYDHRGNILETEDKTTGIVTAYVWGYNKRYPIAKVINATYASIEAILTSSEF